MTAPAPAGAPNRTAPGAAGCFDGDTANLGCATAPGDASPGLVVRVPCEADGQVSSAVSKVVVFAAPANGTSSSGLRGFVLQAADAGGAVREAFSFPGAGPRYEFALGGARGWGWGGAGL